MNLKFANSTCVVRWGERLVRIAQDEAWNADDPFVKARPELFSDRPVHVFGARGLDYEPPIETGTRRPGERRATRAK